MVGSIVCRCGFFAHCGVENCFSQLLLILRAIRDVSDFHVGRHTLYKEIGLRFVHYNSYVIRRDFFQFNDLHGSL